MEKTRNESQPYTSKDYDQKLQRAKERLLKLLHVAASRVEGGLQHGNAALLYERAKVILVCTYFSPEVRLCDECGGNGVEARTVESPSKDTRTVTLVRTTKVHRRKENPESDEDRFN